MTVTDQTMKDIADAIRSKTDKTATMKVTGMASEVRSITPTQGIPIHVTAYEMTDGGTVYLEGVSVTISSSMDTFMGVTNDAGLVDIYVVRGFDYTVTMELEGYITERHVIHVDDAPSYNAPQRMYPKQFFGVEVDQNISECASAVSYPVYLFTYDGEGKIVGTYDNLAVGSTSMSGAWTTFKPGSWAYEPHSRLIEGIKPVSFDGTTWTDLEKASELNWPTDKDCFTEFPFRWLSITRSGHMMSVVFCIGGETPPDETFVADAFLSSDGKTIKDRFRLGCYTASGDSNGIYSKIYQPNATGLTVSQFYMGAAGRNGSTSGVEYGPYDCITYAMWTYVQALYLVLYQDRDSQRAHSDGMINQTIVDDNNIIPSYSNDYGMYGTDLEAERVNAFFWLHNIWGNLATVTASIATRISDEAIVVFKDAMSAYFNWDVGSWGSTTQPSNFNGVGEVIGTGVMNPGFIKEVYGNNKGGFLAMPFTLGPGTAHTYWADMGLTGTEVGGGSNVYMLGGDAYLGDECGMFCAMTRCPTTGTGNTTRLAYRGRRPRGN